MIRVGLVGATGVVGSEILSVLERKQIPIKELICFASSKSQGKQVSFSGKQLPIHTLCETSFKGLDVVLFAAGKKVSSLFAPQAIEQGAIVIDASSAFRMSPEVPLIIPEINAHALTQEHRLIASPNCSTTIMLMALAPLHKHVRIKRVVAATYQAASGAGFTAMRELEGETLAYLKGEKDFQRTVIPHPYAFNLFLHNSPINQEGYCEEELKMIEESRKILEEPSFCVNATCVRVPVLRAHSEALNISFEGPLSVDEAYALLRSAPGIALLEEREKGRFAMPSDASYQDAVFCGRIRKDLSQENTLDLWVVGDQLLKGAALNVVQILQLFTQKGSPCALSFS